MAIRIVADSAFEARRATLDQKGLHYQGGPLGLTRHFAFADIVCVLRAADGSVSWQVGKEVFSLPLKAGNPQHDQFVTTLVQEVRRAGS